MAKCASPIRRGTCSWSRSAAGRNSTMDFGLFSNGERTNQIAADSYDEDLYENRLADRLGFKEARISEHLRGTHGSRPDALSAADLFICKAAAVTKHIKFGPGVRPIPL